MNKILVIQTAFIGDAILATGIIEKLHKVYPNAAIDYLVRKGNETLFTDHPFLNNILIWDKKKSKYINLLKLLVKIRKNKYDVVVNVQRFAAAGLLTAFSNAQQKIGFSKNPFSFLFTKKIKHVIGNEFNYIHEVERNHKLIQDITDEYFEKPKLYPNHSAIETTQIYKKTKYYCIAPSSVWFTKQLPVNKWLELIKTLNKDHIIYLLGGNEDIIMCKQIKDSMQSSKNIVNLAGKLSFQQSVALIKDAQMNYVNDSAPMHMASAVNANTTAIYCSTVPHFGFGPLSDTSFIIQSNQNLSCKPCGLHGKSICPIKTFDCAQKIIFH